MKSITVKLLLPDAICNLIEERSKAEGVEPAHYCSSLITESVGGGIKSPIPIPLNGHHQLHSTINSNLPDTVEQILAVCNLVWRKKMDFADAVRKVAKDLNIQETTVRDKCTRRISLPHAPIDTERFLGMLARPNALRDYLCHRFPKHSRDIIQHFATLSPEVLP